MYVAGGRLRRFGSMDALPEFQAPDARLMKVILGWLREGKDVTTRRGRGGGVTSSHHHEHDITINI